MLLIPKYIHSCVTGRVFHRRARNDRQVCPFDIQIETPFVYLHIVSDLKNFNCGMIAELWCKIIGGVLNTVGGAIHSAG